MAWTLSMWMAPFKSTGFHFICERFALELPYVHLPCPTSMCTAYRHAGRDWHRPLQRFTFHVPSRPLSFYLCWELRTRTTSLCRVEHGLIRDMQGAQRLPIPHNSRNHTACVQAPALTYCGVAWEHQKSAIPHGWPFTWFGELGLNQLSLRHCKTVDRWWFTHQPRNLPVHTAFIIESHISWCAKPHSTFPL